MTMNSYSATLAGIGVLGAMAAAGCGRSAGDGEYDTRREFAALRAQYIPTHDTLLSLWQATDRMNKILEYQIIEPMIDTTPPPPTCPPRCLNLIPPVPEPRAP
jgi:hypothetical protein